ncbi:GMC family oxidoreductase [Rhodalgimonas zhirmunskyi]|uniref:GMC family oxidoreductase n=1 Tax=Rhodalgimonas zhirmunskyi TaxID=2964767 RepID=A0AAJ1U899_9RHOB|nr:GMC family oxidoreductase [Rhodoalgimonas zhirmunskyi]MDQ2093153.1 GMC family oxidoreductase [Rhodoalgimonas zhirmunskyi]
MTDALLQTHWDVIVIGTGIGGGTAGRALAEAGLKTLFLEKGPAGYRAERTALSHEVFLPEARLTRGFWPGQIVARQNGTESRFFGPLGAGVGGSSVFYAATLERPEPHDLDDSPEKPHPTGGWPVSFDAFAPYIERAERLYHISGDPHAPGQDHLAPARPLSPADQRIAERLRRNGHAPYALHSAIRHVDGCLGCLGKCPLPCKMDGRSAGVEPALATGNAALLDHCDVTRLRTRDAQITQIEARHHGRPVTLTARHVLLAGGAFGSPRLCLASTSEAHPKGLANSSGLVGRNLMFHLNELFALWPGTSDPAPSKAIGLRDLYHLNGQRLGMVQAMGVSASYGEIAYYLRTLIDRSALRHIPLAGELSRIPAAAAAKLLGSAKIFVGLLEDMPYAENRVLPPDPGSDDIAFTYTLHPELAARRRAFRRAISRAFRGQRRMFLNHAPDLNHGHPTGTMRFGTDPATSVLTPWGRAHDHPNLWVADAGFMPTSMGVNPSLTIAAQALRTADAIKDSLT